ncbi:MAG: peptidoglycan-binding protein [bacterium]
MKKRVSQFLLITIFLIGIVFQCSRPVYADTLLLQPASVISALKVYLQEILKQFLELQKQAEQVLKAAQETKQKQDFQFVSDLHYGSQGEEVSELQEFLSYDVDVYPSGLVTGYYGTLTENAVKQFQKQSGLSETGIVDAQTREQLNKKEKISSSDEVALSPIPTTAPEEQQKQVEEKQEVSSLPQTQETDSQDSDDRVQLPVVSSAIYTINKAPIYDVFQLATSIHEKVNERRVLYGKKPLVWDEHVAAVAREHSIDQAHDNEEITDPARRCHYPLIRHEGFLFGFTAGNRMQKRGISYQSVGENIAMVPVVKNLVYRYPAGDEPIDCPVVDRFSSGHWYDMDAAYASYQEILQASKSAVQIVPPVDWVNKEWKTMDDVATEVVEGWMNSPGHRENLLRDGFTRGGMGVAQVNDYIITTHILFYP